MGGTGIFFTTRWILRNLPVSTDEEHKALLELWKQNQYDAIIGTTEEKLQKNVDYDTGFDIYKAIREACEFTQRVPNI